MCNAWNHPPGCPCPWGGGGASGRNPFGNGSYRNNFSFHIPKYELHKYSVFSRVVSFRSYVNPNATCPICGASVFFYQSPYGGRVFFDELGPPWPKHPCTNSSFDSTRSRTSSANSIRASIQMTGEKVLRLDVDRLPVNTPIEASHWKRSIWSPLVCEEIRETPTHYARLSARVVYIENGYLVESPLLTIYTSCSPCSLEDRPLFIRRHPKYRGKYEISSFSFGSAESAIEPISLVANISSFYPLERIIKGHTLSGSNKARLVKKKDIETHYKSKKIYKTQARLTNIKRSSSRSKPLTAKKYKKNTNKQAQAPIHNQIPIESVNKLAEELAKNGKSDQSNIS